MILFLSILITTIPMMDYSEIVPGMVGFGLTVFEGTLPDTFGVEIIGKQEGYAPGQNLIIAELTGERIEETGLISGMSGSPVYIEGKLIGAVSRNLGGPFSKKPICGITPIESVLDPPITGYTPIPKEQKISLPLCFSNISDLAMSLIFTSGEFDLLDFHPSHSSSSKGDIQYQEPRPGSSIGVLLVTGDATLGAFGTATHIDKNKIYAFGHSFMGLGNAILPVTTSRIYTVASSYYASFKMAEMGDIIGCTELDAFTGIIAKIGKEPTMVDIMIKSGEKHYNYKIVKEERLLPLLTRLMLASSILTEYSRGEITYSAALNINSEERLIKLTDTYSGDVIDVVTEIGEDISTVIDNGFKRLNIESMEFELSPTDELRIAMIRDLNGYMMGDTLNVICTIIPFRDKPFRLEKKIPIRKSDKKESLTVTASNRDIQGNSMYEISDFDGLINYLETRPSKTSIVIQVSGSDNRLVPSSYAKFIVKDPKPAYERIVKTDWVILGLAKCEVKID